MVTPPGLESVEDFLPYVLEFINDISPYETINPLAETNGLSEYVFTGYQATSIRFTDIFFSVESGSLIPLPE